MKRISLLIVCFLASLTFAWAQNKVTFNETTHDFGQVPEKGGNVSCDFILTNQTNVPMVISRVTASCGCTTPAWTKEPVAPGKTGKVTATYAPLGRPVPFSKTISVYTNVQDEPFILTIKGDVIAGKASPEEEFPIAFGYLRLKQNMIFFNQIGAAENRKMDVEVYNSASAPISLKFDKLPKYITVTTDPVAIPAATAAKMTITVNAKMAQKYGKFNDIFNIIVANDVKGAANNKFTVNGVFTNDFSQAGDPANAPKMNLSTSQIHFDKSAGNPSYVLKISNSGKSDLKLLDIQSDNPVVVLSKNKGVVKPGDIFEAKVYLQSQKIKSQLSSTITIVTNDPNSAVKDITVTANPQ